MYINEIHINWMKRINYEITSPFIVIEMCMFFAMKVLMLKSDISYISNLK